MVFFESNKANLDSALKSLQSYGLTVERNGDELICFRNASPKLSVSIVTGDYVQEESEAISMGSPYEKEMKKCNARFEVEFNNLGEVLAEINTMMDVQGALQDVSKGYLFTPWNTMLTEYWID